jgi:hypothetical protein
MVLCFNMLYGIYTCLGAIINNLVFPFGYTSTATSIFGATFICSGIIGSMIFSLYVDKTNKYIRTLRIIAFGSLGSTALIWVTLPSD